MATSIKLELQKNQLKLEYFKARHTQKPNELDKKWVEIYSDRVKKLERQLLKAQAKAAVTTSRAH